MHDQSTPVDRVKPCSRCGEVKPSSAFSPDRRKSDGLQSRCKACLADIGRARYQANPESERVRARRWQTQHPERARETALRWKAENPERVSEQGRQWKSEHPERHYAANRRWQEANPERAAMTKRAVGIVQRALIHGDLVRPSACDECSQVGTVQAAHSDYSRPLDVRWLCHRCHRIWDAAEPKTLPSQPEEVTGAP